MSVLDRLSARRVGRGASIVGIALLATATLASAPAGAATPATCINGPIVDLANPSAGDLLSSGDYIVSGVARDPSAATGDGIDRVELFVGSRELGGTEVGAAVPNQGRFAVTAKLPTNVAGSTSFVVHAHSAVTGQETSVSVPVYLGVAPTAVPHTSNQPAATPVVPPVAPLSCAPSSAGAVAPAPATGSSTAPASVAAAAIEGAPVLQLANPSAGDTVLLGDYIISGSAYVPNTAQGVGVDRVEFFLGNRDQGGTYLGSATPGHGGGMSASSGSLLAMGGFATKVTVPNQLRGTTSTFYAYAQNAATGQETVVSAPVNVGAPPTPTPHPSTAS